MTRIYKNLSVWANVFKQPKYIFITIAVAFLFYLLNVLISNIRNLASYYKYYGLGMTMTFFVKLLIGFKSTILAHSFAALIVISLLLGILASLIIYKASCFNFSDRSKNEGGLIGVLGVSLGILAPGCVACGIGIISLIGVSGGVLSLLPYEGFEFSILSILLLVAAILQFTKNIYVCNLKKKGEGIKIWKWRR